MARYIDADKLAKIYMLKGKDKLRLATVINELEMASTADVVPKSEVEKIFKEIEKIILDNTYPDFNREHKAVNIWKATTGYDAFYELKKKYTGQAVEKVERCVVCGDVIPEGRQVCPQCERLH